MWSENIWISSISPCLIKFERNCHHQVREEEMLLNMKAVLSRCCSWASGLSCRNSRFSHLSGLCGQRTKENQAVSSLFPGLLAEAAPAGRRCVIKDPGSSARKASTCWGSVARSHFSGQEANTLNWVDSSRGLQLPMATCPSYTLAMYSQRLTMLQANDSLP